MKTRLSTKNGIIVKWFLWAGRGLALLQGDLYNGPEFSNRSRNRWTSDSVRPTSPLFILTAQSVPSRTKRRSVELSLTGGTLAYLVAFPRSHWLTETMMLRTRRVCLLISADSDVAEGSHLEKLNRGVGAGVKCRALEVPAFCPTAWCPTLKANADGSHQGDAKALCWWTEPAATYAVRTSTRPNGPPRPIGRRCATKRE